MLIFSPKSCCLGSRQLVRQKVNIHYSKVYDKVESTTKKYILNMKNCIKRSNKTNGNHSKNVKLLPLYAPQLMFFWLEFYGKLYWVLQAQWNICLRGFILKHIPNNPCKDSANVTAKFENTLNFPGYVWCVNVSL